MPKFKVGDVLKVTSTSSNTLTVEEVSATHYRIKWSDGGSYSYSHDAIDSCCTLVRAPKPDPPKVVVLTRWYNVYAGGVSESYPSRRDADEEADEDRIGCKKVVFMSGEYDD